MFGSYHHFNQSVSLTIFDFLLLCFWHWNYRRKQSAGRKGATLQKRTSLKFRFSNTRSRVKNCVTNARYFRASDLFYFYFHFFGVLFLQQIYLTPECTKRILLSHSTHLDLTVFTLSSLHSLTLLTSFSPSYPCSHSPHLIHILPTSLTLSSPRSHSPHLIITLFTLFSLSSPRSNSPYLILILYSVIP